MQILAAILFVFSAVAFRLVTGMGGAPHWQNFAPMVGIAFCMGMALPWRIALPVTFGALLASDVVLNAYYASGSAGASFLSFMFSPWMLVNYSLYAGVFILGHRLAAHRGSFAMMLGGTIAGVLAFYLVSNTGSWMSSPGYAKSLAGWWQAQTTGLPGFPPSLVFLRNQLAGNAIFALIFLLFVVKPHLSVSPRWGARVSPEA